jgi:AcrR family transcriptional regulator
MADAVLAIVAERGLSAVSLAEVAARAGVSGGRVQHYFGTKQELIEAAFLRANELASDRIDVHPGADSPGGALRVVLTELIPHDEPTALHMRVRQSFTALALADEAIAARLREDYARLHRRLAELVAAEQAGGNIAEGVDPYAAAVALVALTEGLAYYVLIGVRLEQDARDAVLAAIAELGPTSPLGGPR